MTKLLVAMISMAVLALAGCPERPTPAKAEEGCKNMITLQFWEGFDRSFKKKNSDPKALKLAKATGQKKYDKAMKKGGSLHANIGKCVELVTKKGTVKQAQCMKDAKSASEADACVK